MKTCALLDRGSVPIAATVVANVTPAVRKKPRREDGASPTESVVELAVELGDSAWHRVLRLRTVTVAGMNACKCPMDVVVGCMGKVVNGLGVRAMMMMVDDTAVEVNLSCAWYVAKYTRRSVHVAQEDSRRVDRGVM